VPTLKTQPKDKKITHLTPITFGRIQTTLGQPKTTGIKILFDSGSTQTHVKRDCVKKLRLRRDKTATWNTAAGPVDTNERCKVLFSLPEFSPTKVIEWEVHVGTFASKNYDMIIGNDLLQTLKIDLQYSTSTIEWDGTEKPMRSRDATIANSYCISDTPCLEEAAERIKQILDAKYEPANLDEITASCTHLTNEEQYELNLLLKKYESLFDGTLGIWKGEDYDIELRNDAKPDHSRAYPIPRIHEQTLRHEVDRLCQIGK
jgi:hypothetical protein